MQKLLSIEAWPTTSETVMQVLFCWLAVSTLGNHRAWGYMLNKRHSKSASGNGRVFSPFQWLRMVRACHGRRSGLDLTPEFRSARQGLGTQLAGLYHQQSRCHMVTSFFH